MKKFAFVAATAATLAVASAGMLVNSGAARAEPIRLAQADVSVRVGEPHHARRGMYHRGWHARGCRTVTIKERHGNRVVIKKIRRC